MWWWIFVKCSSNKVCLILRIGNFGRFVGSFFAIKKEIDIPRLQLIFAVAVIFDILTQNWFANELSDTIFVHVIGLHAKWRITVLKDRQANISWLSFLPADLHVFQFSTASQAGSGTDEASRLHVHRLESTTRYAREWEGKWRERHAQFAFSLEVPWKKTCQYFSFDIPSKLLYAPDVNTIRRACNHFPGSFSSETSSKKMAKKSNQSFNLSCPRSNLYYPL